MAVAVTLTTKCPCCIALHMKDARAAGAADQMPAERATVAASMRAGGRDHSRYASFRQ
jgi:AhpD family alkylhydroperoxidase